MIICVYILSFDSSRLNNSATADNRKKNGQRFGKKCIKYYSLLSVDALSINDKYYWWIGNGHWSYAGTSVVPVGILIDG